LDDPAPFSFFRDLHGAFSVSRAALGGSGPSFRIIAGTARRVLARRRRLRFFGLFFSFSGNFCAGGLLAAGGPRRSQAGLFLGRGTLGALFFTRRRFFWAASSFLFFRDFLRNVGPFSSYEPSRSRHGRPTFPCSLEGTPYVVFLDSDPAVSFAATLSPFNL